MVTCTGHIGIHEGVDRRTYVRTDVHDVMAMKPNFLTSMGYHIFLSMVLRYYFLYGIRFSFMQLHWHDWHNYVAMVSYCTFVNKSKF